MSPRRGGEAAKFGERFEGRWTVAQLLEVLRGTAISLTVEDEAVLAKGAEFTLRRVGGREVHQVKLEPGMAPSWTLRALELEGVLEAAGVHAGAGREFHFVSTVRAPWLARLADEARRSKNAASFARVFGQDKTAHDELAKLQKVWGGKAAAWNVLTKVRVHLVDERYLQSTNAALAELYLQGGEGSLIASGLGDLIVDNLGRELDVSAIHELLGGYGLAPAPLRDPATLAEAVASATRRWRDSAMPRVIQPAIEREEAATIAATLRDTSGAVVLVSGAAGGGKSAVLAQVVDELDDWPVLAMRIDRRQPFETPAQLGTQLDLPASPVTALGALAGDRPSLLLVDQLDAVSLASGRLADALEPILEMVREAGAFGEMRVLLACRQYDLEHDPRLRELVAEEGSAQLVPVGPLSGEQVEAAVRTLGLEPASLSAEQRELLALPLNLVLLAAVIDQEDALGFGTTNDLLRAYYGRKELDAARRAAPGRVRFGGVLTTLAQAMSEREQLSVPSAVLDADDLGPDARILISEGVLVEDGDRLAFFHEALFDYTFARAWVGRQDDLLEWLLAGEQELFCRAQVRQILVHLHDVEPARLRREVRRCLTDARVRFHVKDAVLSVLAALREPSDADWAMVLELRESTPELAERLRAALWSEAWFRRADAQGALEPWLDSGDQEQIFMALEIMRGGLARHGERVAELVRRLDHDDQYAGAVTWLVRAAREHVSRGLFDQALALVREGRSQPEHELFMTFYTLPAVKPEWACELLAAWLIDRPGALASDGRGNLTALESRDHGAVRVMATAARSAPLPFARRFLPFVLQVIELLAVDTEQRPQPDGQFMFRDVAGEEEDRGADEALLHGLASALQVIGAEHPDELPALIEPLLDTDYDTAQWLAYTGLAAAGAAHAAWAADVVLERPSRLESGYMDNPHWTVRELLLAIGDALDDERVAALEAAILGMEASHPYVELTLLTGLPEARLSEAGRKRLAQLRAELGLEQPEAPQPMVRDAWVGSPVPKEEGAELDDEGWLAVMREYDTDERPGFEGGALEVASVLEDLAKAAPERFVRLGLRLDASYNPTYLSRLLTATADPAKGAEPADPETIFALVRHAAGLGLPDLERYVAWPLQPLADGEIPEDIIELVLRLARGARSPQHGGLPSPGVDLVGNPVESPPDLLMAGINTARGQAVTVLARLVGADPDGRRTALVAGSLVELAGDPSLSVRAVVARLLLAALHHAREEAVAAAAVLLDADDVLLTAQPVQELCFWLDDDAIVRRMLASGLDDVRVAGGELAAYAAIERGVTELLAEALEGDVATRRGAVSLCARRVAAAGDAELTETTLRDAFADADEAVRKASAGIAAALRGRPLRPHAGLLAALIASPAFAAAINQLAITLERAPDRIDDLLAATVEHFLKEFSDEARSIQTGAAGAAHELATLVLRWYAQAEQPDSRRRALDLLDKMLEAQSFGVQELVSGAER